MENPDKMTILESILSDVEEDLFDEEILHLLLDKRVSRDVSGKEKYTFGQQAADRLARFAGSWRFIIIFSVLLAAWIAVNFALSGRAFDPYPFILLNLLLSCTAAIQAPLIMMSQNRQEEKDRRRAENDYKVNLKTEIIIEDIHRKLDRILENQQKNSKTDGAGE